MRIAVVVHAESHGGAEIFLQRLYHREAPGCPGDDVRLFGSIPGWDETGWPTTDLNLGPKWSRRTLAKGLRDLAAERRRVVAAVAQFAPDLIHMQFKREQIGFTTALSKIAPVVWTEHGRLTTGNVNRYLGVGYWAASGSTTAIVAVSRDVERQVIRFGRSPHSTVISNGVDAHHFQPPTTTERAKARAHYGVLTDAICFAMVGRLHARKGVREAIRAAVATGHTLIIAGTGELENEVREAAATHPEIIYCGWVSDPLSVYHAADAVIMPSTGPEGMPTSMLEGAACGLPTLAAQSAEIDAAVISTGGFVAPSLIAFEHAMLHPEFFVNISTKRAARAYAETNTWISKRRHYGELFDAAIHSDDHKRQRALAGQNRRKRIIILGTAEWNAPIATNQQYVTRALAQANDVTFVESIALRTPKLNTQDLRRIGLRLARAVAPRKIPTAAARPVPLGVDVVSPLIIPIHNALTYPLNWGLLRLALGDRPWRRQRYDVCWLYTPVTYGLHERASGTCYHCVDLLRTVEGISQSMIDRAERAASLFVDHAIATSQVVKGHLCDTGFQRVQLLENVAETDVFGAWDEATSTRRNVFVYGGALSEQKIDLSLLEDLAHAAVDKAEIALAGPVSGGRVFTERLDALCARDNVHHHGVLSIGELAKLYQSASVGIMPYAVNTYTRGISPLKTFEFLAAGLPVVSVALPGVPKVHGLTVPADSRDVFVHESMAALETERAVREECRVAAQAHDWTERGAVVRKIAADLA